MAMATVALKAFLAWLTGPFEFLKRLGFSILLTLLLFISISLLLLSILQDQHEIESLKAQNEKIRQHTLLHRQSQQWFAHFFSHVQGYQEQLNRPLLALDWMDWLSKWQKTYKQPWPETQFNVIDVVDDWQSYHMQMAISIRDQDDYQAWLAWQPNALYQGVIPTGCRWRAQDDQTKSHSFSGRIECHWQALFWNAPDAQWQEDIQFSENVSSPLSTETLVESETLPESSAIYARNQALFGGVIIHKEQVTVKLGESWYWLPTHWCDWKVNKYDGLFLVLKNTSPLVAESYIGLGEALPSCSRFKIE